MSGFVTVLVEQRVCYQDGNVCDKNCIYLQAQPESRGGGYVCELFDERVDQRQRLPACVAAEQRHGAAPAPTCNCGQPATICRPCLDNAVWEESMGEDL